MGMPTCSFTDHLEAWRFGGMIQMTNLDTPNQIIRMLGLLPLPREGGWYRETWRLPGSPGLISGDKCQSSATAIYYLLTPGQHSKLHRLPKPEMYFYHAGAPLQLLVLDEDYFPDGREIVVGPNLELGHVPQFEVPGGAIHGSRPLGDPGWSLVSTVMVPGFEPNDYNEPDIEFLIQKYPLFSYKIRSLG